jgi:dTDP-glucose pyrophosphorylase
MSKRLQLITICPKESLFAALKAIDRGGCEIALIVDEGNHLLGVLTDGDIRRALLRKSSLDESVDKHMIKQFISVQPEAGRAEVLDIMRARSLTQIPIINIERRLLGLHLLREIIGTMARPNWAIVMAGGRGERLRPLTDSLPKPMIRVAGRPILERIVLHLVGQGFQKIFLSVNFMATMIEDHFGDGSNFGCEIRYIREREPLGTGGALALLPEKPEHPLLVMNGDLVTQFDAIGMLAFHAEGDYQATVGCYEYVHTVPYGVLDLSEDRVTRMREKPRESWTVNAGIYTLEPALLARLPEDACFPLPVLVEGCLERNERVGAYRIAGDWIDVGHQQELSRARGKERPT